MIENTRNFSIPVGIPELEQVLSHCHSAAHGGVRSGTLFQICGPSMVGKSFLLQSIVSAICKEYCINENCPIMHLNVYLCATPGEEALWYNPHLQTWMTKRTELSNTFMNVFTVSIQHPNNLIELFAFLESKHEKTERTQSIIFIDSLRFVWHELISTRTSQHQINWFYLNLLCKIRSLLDRDGSTQRFTVVLTNGTSNFKKLHLSVQDGPGDISLPLPLGGEAWCSGVDTTLFLEPLYTAGSEDGDRIRLHTRATLLEEGRIASCVYPFK